MLLSLRLAIFTSILVVISRGCAGKQCIFFQDSEAPNGKKAVLQCPTPNDPPDYKDCCQNHCCLPHAPIYNIDDRLIMIVGVTVICTCLVLTLVVIVCCFWSRCPMYNTCRVSYLQGDIIADSKDDDLLNSSMPTEEKSGQTHYSPNVKIKLMQDI